MNVAGNAVSVIVPTFNRAHYLRASLDSLLAQSVPPVQVIVVDDGSNDRTSEVAATYGNQVVYLRKENAGKSRAVALGLTVARGDWIWIFDDDDIALPHAIEDRLSVAAAFPDASFIYAPHLLGVDDAKDVSHGIRITGTHDPGLVPKERFALEVMRGCFLSLNSCLIKRATFVALGGFDANLLRSQDYDFLIRLSRTSTPAYCPRPVFIVRVHEGERGPAALRHASIDRRKQFLHFSRTIGKKLLQDSALGEYSVPPTNAILSGDERTAALLNRMQVMANHGCVEEMFADLREILMELAHRSKRLQKDEGLLVQHAACIGLADDASSVYWSIYKREARATTLLVGGPQALRWLARGRLLMAKGYPGSPATRVARLRQAVWLAYQSFNWRTPRETPQN